MGVAVIVFATAAYGQDEPIPAAVARKPAAVSNPKSQVIYHLPQQSGGGDALRAQAKYEAAVRESVQPAPFPNGGINATANKPSARSVTATRSSVRPKFSPAKRHAPAGENRSGRPGKKSHGH